MRFIPHDYQKRAIDFVLAQPRALLFLEMGLGKTVVTLSAIQRLLDWGEITKVLVIAPKKVAESTWAHEAEEWDHLSLKVVSITGSVSQRRKALQTPADVYVLGRNSLVWLIEETGKEFDFDMLVIDELTSFKNPSSLRFKALRRVLPLISRIAGLTGTPTPNGLIDLWAQVYCIDQGKRLGKFVTHYRKEYFNPVMYNNIVIKCPPKKGALKQVMSKISDISLTMRAKDWLHLPPIMYEDCPVKLTDKELKQYLDFEKDQVMAFGKDIITASSAAALINKLAQFANGAIYDDDKMVKEIHTAKIDRLVEILESEDTPLLCFYQYQHDRDRIIKAFAKKKVRVYSCDQDLQDWNAGKIDLLLAHPASTAFGLNMQKGGSRIVWFSTGWNLELYQQANARLHRQGQQYPVRVFKLIASGTVDEKMSAALDDKNTMQSSVVKLLASKVINSI